MLKEKKKKKIRSFQAKREILTILRQNVILTNLIRAKL